MTNKQRALLKRLRSMQALPKKKGLHEGCNTDFCFCCVNRRKCSIYQTECSL